MNFFPHLVKALSHELRQCLLDNARGKGELTAPFNYDQLIAIQEQEAK